MKKIKGWVLFTTPRPSVFKVIMAISVLSLFSILSILINKYLTIPDLLKLDGKNNFVKESSVETGLLGGYGFVFLDLAMIIAVIRNNKKSQPVESFLFIFSILWMIVFPVLHSPLLILWAHLHHYSIDHYEAAHRGGWYIFKLDGKL
ncbi:hypothetical protein [Swingsia samuiensis]|uniref:Uncharacterized protein n=1 Tax=Swingsia samuiensis TaxID=1293412 RepID=A0A4Y6UKG6_9PROT|nr:hypothetical protein [Swingsia samuiensis]QDH16877.1 hypothetical protein E3D00_04330 [Swingsia samuiensis]